MKTVRELAAELNLSKSTLHRLIHDNNIETIQQGNKRLIDETIEKAIIQALQEKTLQGETIQNDSETFQKRCRNVSRNDYETIQNDKEQQLLQQLEQLKAQIEELKEDKQKLNERLDRAERDRTELIAANRELTVALKAAQALHGLDKQRKMIETTSAPKDEPKKAPVQKQRDTKQPAKPAKRNILGFFGRITKRKIH